MLERFTDEECDVLRGNLGHATANKLIALANSACDACEKESEPDPRVAELQKRVDAMDRLMKAQAPAPAAKAPSPAPSDSKPAG